MDTVVKLNPIQQRIKEGMSPIQAFLTDATCGEGCWEAREEVCRCSCGGKNHGCMKIEGTRPDRTAKIDGFFYKLIFSSIGMPWKEYEEKMKTVPNFPCDCGKEHKAGLRTVEKGMWHYYWKETDKGAPYRIKPASKQQLEKWPELESYKNKNRWETVYLLWEKLS